LTGRRIRYKISIDPVLDLNFPALFTTTGNPIIYISLGMYVRTTIMEKRPGKSAKRGLFVDILIL